MYIDKQVEDHDENLNGCIIERNPLVFSFEKIAGKCIKYVKAIKKKRVKSQYAKKKVHNIIIFVDFSFFR